MQSGGLGKTAPETQKRSQVPNGPKQGSQKATIAFSSSGQPIMLRKLLMVKTSFTTPLS